MKVEWEVTFNSNLTFGVFRDIYKCLETAKQLGYPFIIWNGRIYQTSDGAHLGIAED